MFPRIGLAALGGALLLSGTVLVGYVAAQPSAPTDDDPLAQFGVLMPVFSSPRCINCHGGTNPQLDVNHEGGQVDVQMDGAGNMNQGTNAACLECHTAPAAKAGDWRLAPLPMSFVGRDTLAMCRQMRSFNTLNDPARRPGFIDHLQSDQLIGLAFEGQGAIGDDSAFAPIAADPPPMSRADFVTAAQQWVDGGAACSKWNGTITETTTATERVQFRESGTDSKLVISVVDNQASASVHWAMHDFTDVATKTCNVYTHQTFSADADRIPIDITLVLNQRSIPSGPSATSGLPPGFQLPPGVELPPGFSLPPGLTLPGGPSVSTFFRYSNSGQPIPGNHHSDSVTEPGCKRLVTDQAQPYQIAGALIPVTVDANDPDHVMGENSAASGPTGRIVIQWDLHRGD